MRRLALEMRKNLGRRNQRLELVARIERRAAFQVAQEFQVTDERSDDQDPDVVGARQFVEAHVEILAEREQSANHCRDGFGGGRVAVNEILQHVEVVGTEEQLAGRRGSVAARAADLLGEILQALGRVVVVDVADVGLVDPHAEGDRGHDDSLVRREKPILDRRPLDVFQARMIGPGGEARLAEPLGQLFRGALERDVDDRRAGLAAAESLDQLGIALGRMDRCRQKREVGAIEARARHSGVTSNSRQMSLSTASVAVAVRASSRSAWHNLAKWASFR